MGVGVGWSLKRSRSLSEVGQRTNFVIGGTLRLLQRPIGGTGGVVVVGGGEGLVENKSEDCGT